MIQGQKAENGGHLNGPAVALSVITVCRNAAAHLSRTIASVASQTERNQFEYLIVDGASTDATADLIRSAAAAGQVDRWISEPDNGIYDAMNKAAGLAKGEFILFMNSADLFETIDAIEKMLHYFPKTTTDGPDLLYGDCIMVYPDGSPVYDTARMPDQLRHRMICSHQSLFARRSLLLAQPFNTAYPICADYDFMLAMWLNGARFLHAPLPVARVQLEYYTFPQITNGHRQKRTAAMARLGYHTRWRFDLGWIALFAKHILKRLLGRATLRKVNH